MFVILVYDVNTRRVAKVRKTAEKYLKPVQKSVFEGFLTDRSLSKLQGELARIIDCDADSVLIYKQSFGGFTKCSLGKIYSDGDYIL